MIIKQTRKTEREDGNLWCEWYLIDTERKCGVHFHGLQWSYGNLERAHMWAEINNSRFQAHGIEVHSPTPLYEGQTPVSNCFVTGGDCYCDGSSIAAERELGWINPDAPDQKHIWAVLEDWFCAKFGKNDAPHNKSQSRNAKCNETCPTDSGDDEGKEIES